MVKESEAGPNAADQRLQRQREGVRIQPYAAEFQRIFKALNLEWIERYWTPEPADFEALDDPEGKIIGPGGYIALAMVGDIVIGTCALIPRARPEAEFELAKMCVSEHCKGLGIGELLGRTVIAEARRRAATSLYLETNHQLRPAIALYRKLGFRELPAQPSPYQRADVFMRLEL